MSLWVLVILAFLATSASASLIFNRPIIFIFENEYADSVLANPEFKSLADRGTYLSNYYAIGHPSQPNYIALVAGDTLGVTSDGYITFPSTIQSIANLLEAKNLTWKAYAEDYPGNCFDGTSKGNYARKHVPLQSFEWVRNNHCGNIVDASQLQIDVAAGQLPAFSFYTPNMLNDGHNTNIDYAANWLKKTLEPLLTEPGFAENTLIVITWDEDDYSHDNKVYTALLGSHIPSGKTDSTRYDHYSLLRTIEDGLNLGSLGRNDATATPIDASIQVVIT